MHRSLFCALPALLSLTLAGAALAQDQAQDQMDVKAIWNDPVFQRQFIASYGVNAEIEPRVTQEEVAILEKVRPLMAEDLPQAEVQLQKQMKPDGSAMLDFTLAGIQFQQDKRSEALANYKKAVGKFPSFQRAWRNMGLIHARDAQYNDAVKAFTRMIELGGGDAYSYGLLGFSYAALEDYQPAEASFRNALLLQPDNTEWRLGLTRCVLKQQKFEDAATLLDALIQRYPDKADFWLLQAHAYLGMKLPVKAAENFEVVDRLGHSSVDSLATLGDIYVTENLLDLAVSAYLRSIDVNPQQPPARPMRSAELMVARGALPQAGQVTARIREVLGPGLEGADRSKLLKLDSRIRMSQGADDEQTAAVLKEIVALDPLDGEALMLLGQYYTRQDQPDQAIFYFERAESLEAFEFNARLRHAQVLVGQGRYADAVPLLRRVQEIRPREDVARYLEQVERFARSQR